MTSSELLYSDPMAAANAAAQEIIERTGVSAHNVALIMGSGWVSAVDALGSPSFECNAEELTGFLPPTVEGHSGKVRSYEIEAGGKKLRALVFLGRTHLYEGKGVEPVVHSVRTAVKAGCTIIILTNACGGINTKYRVGQPVLIRDHISLTAVSPLSGAVFVDLTDLYSKRIREIVKREDATLDEGVYVHWRGPTYETPAEIHMMRTMGGDLVGMSNW
ncbi:MAG: purine-nucleoside phosphorylase [Actinobacteria bacterium]|nr:purine-nucleoside phosphorylase [Actinomycetota bacterium]